MTSQLLITRAGCLETHRKATGSEAKRLLGYFGNPRVLPGGQKRAHVPSGRRLSGSKDRPGTQGHRKLFVFNFQGHWGSRVQMQMGVT